MSRYLILAPVLALLLFTQNATAESGVAFSVEGTRIERAEGAAPATDIRNFLDVAPVISELVVMDANNNVVTDLVRGGQYSFMAYFVDPICMPFELAEGFFRANGKMVYNISSVWDYSADCNTIGAGFVLTVPMNAPLESYTWGARIVNAEGTDTFYPGYFNIVQ